ncbi:MAG TPA: isoprenylcysteine carboxylmethyltransferase family protein [Pseudolabrys sp.]|jgi:protein-S-isoprenylcysteine O-methyltransferase Ste14|nr:isoprenylcysteine carboxylmethyltransferase family protein [Pseudolabrys sp.]
MTSYFEDIFGKSVLIGIFSLLAFLQINAITEMLHAPDGIERFGTTVIAKAFTLIFLLMTVFLTIKRLPPKSTASGIEPRVTAITGTFILMLLAFVPAGTTGAAVRFVSAVLIVTGTLLSIFCLYWLGRSFSVMATARRLVIQGPYAYVRHPLYVAEAVTTVGIVLLNWSAGAFVIGAVWCVLQFRRAVNEEAVLRSAFIEYDEYARTVPRFIPTLAIARKKRARHSTAAIS